VTEIALITGGAGAIGRSSALVLAEAGFDVITVDRVEAPEPEGQHHIVGDISHEETWRHVVSRLDAAKRKVGAVVHTAYELERTSHFDMTPESWASQIAVNLSSVQTMFHTLGSDRLAIPCRVVFVSSVHSRIGVPGHSAYAASKGALDALTRQLSVEWGPAARVNSIILGPVKTPVWDGATESEINQAAQATAIGRMGTPTDVAHLVEFLVSEKSDFMTGASVVLDGGFLASRETR
jgi:NAD(P)-dependent dehydrogenase (short-subunit alcohol dehydrogenase family)